MSFGLKAIETVYRNYRFRSRTEARWARFMDEAGCPWTYEQEGYDLDGVWYLPDFYLPRQDCWLEVKGARPGYHSLEHKKAERLAAASKKAVFLISGDVGPGYVIDGFAARRIYQRYRWCVCLRCKMVGIAVEGNGADLPCRCFAPGEQYHSDTWAEITTALAAARQERFGP